MDSLLLEFAKYGLAGILCGVVVGIAVILLRHLLARSDKLDTETIKSAAEAISLIKTQIIGRDADLTWARAKIDANQRDFLDALRAERETRERQTEALFALLRADHKEAMGVLEDVREGVERLAKTSSVVVSA